MVSRVCSTPGCGKLIRLPSKAYRCPACNRKLDKARGTRQDRGYDADHDRLRADWQRRLDDGEQVDCWRCGKRINPRDWMLGHCDIDRSKHHGPEHPKCNLATAGRTHCPHTSHGPPPY